MTINVLSPYGAREPKPAASTNAVYSMQPFSVCTAGTFALNALSTVSRWPTLATISTTTWIIFPVLSLCDVAFKKDVSLTKDYGGSIPARLASHQTMFDTLPWMDCRERSA